MPSGSRIRGRLAYGGVLVVPTRLQGHDVEMLVDTGAAYTAVRVELVALLGLSRAPLPTRAIAPAHGAVQTVPAYRLPTLRLGGHQLREVDIVALTLPPALRLGGLVGMNVLGQFRVTFESDTDTLVLRPRRSARS